MLLGTTMARISVISIARSSNGKRLYESSQVGLKRNR